MSWYQPLQPLAALVAQHVTRLCGDLAAQLLSLTRPSYRSYGGVYCIEIAGELFWVSARQVDQYPDMRLSETSAPGRFRRARPCRLINPDAVTHFSISLL